KKINPDDLLSIWTGFINDPNDENIIELESKVSALHEAKVELARMSRDPKEAEYYRLRQNAMSERMNALLEAEDKGLAKGIAKGLAKGRAEGEKLAKLEVAKTALKNGLTSEIISGITGLSIKEIDELK
ncbi:MAG: Rpn family recombination-promoting nuclease/putative transposase, partial [Cetobacterium sp.]